MEHQGLGVLLHGLYGVLSQRAGGRATVLLWQDPVGLLEGCVTWAGKALQGNFGKEKFSLIPFCSF